MSICSISVEGILSSTERPWRPIRRDAIRRARHSATGVVGLIYAECGGLMYLDGRDP
jgi:hypothetical protein